MSFPYTLPFGLGGDVAGDDDAAASYVGMLERLLPPGWLWGLVEPLLVALLQGCADELGRLHRRITNLLNEADPTTAFELLPEYERDFQLAAASTIAERRANIVARRVRRQRFRPVDFQQALSSLLALAPDQILIIERTRAFVTAIGDDREIFRFFVFRNPALAGTYFIASAQALVDAMKPSHTVGTVIESTSMLYDDPHSLYDRDLLGA